MWHVLRGDTMVYKVRIVKTEKYGLEVFLLYVITSEGETIERQFLSETGAKQGARLLLNKLKQVAA
jgi:ribosomal protein L19